MSISNPDQTLAQVRAHLGAGRYRQAIPLIQSLLAGPGGKKNASLHAALAECYMGLSQVDQALETLDKAIRANPKDPALRTSRGQALLQGRQLEPAVEAFNAAVRINSGWAPAIVGLTETLNMLDRKDEALATLDPLLGSAQVSPPVDIAYARLCPGPGRSAEGIERLERWVENDRVAPAHRISGLFLLGALYDHDQRHDDAFATYEKGNALRPGAFDPARRAAMTDQVIRGSTEASLGAIPESGVRSNKPIFIVGMPRSGTSLIEQVLSCHGRIFGAGELTAVGSLVNALQRLDQSKMRPEELQGFVDRLAEGYLGLLDDLSDGAEFVTDKNPLNFMHLGIISRVFPGARIIHCLRSPIDTCVSCYFHNFMGPTAFTDDLAGLGSYYNDYRRLMAHWRSVIKTPILDVVYEDVVEDLESSARRLLDFLDLDWDPAVTRFNESARVTTTASTEQVRKPIYKTSVQRWRRYEKHLAPLINALEPRFRPDE